MDVVVLDVGLPGLDGFAVLRTIRETSNVPVIMLTGADHEADKVLGLELGADDYVTKPFGLGELRARIKAALNEASGNDLSAQLDLERDSQRELGRSEDFKEGVMAFLGKRKANFKGH